jgi:transcription elongation factor GreB
MSRAFVRETDVPQLPDLPARAAPLPPGVRNYITAAGAQRLRAELTDLLTVRRPALIRAEPDDSDAKRELQTLDRRIRYLQEALRRAEIIAVDAAPPDVVRFGSAATVRESDGSETTYRIVGVDEADAEQNGISWLSPLAQALLNARVGARVTLRTPRGTRELEIRAIRAG